LSTFAPSDHPIDLSGLYSGAAFLLCPGPSLASTPFDLLRSPGLATMTLNRAAYLFHGTFHIAADSPEHTPDSIWRDPNVVKFLPRGRAPRDWPRYPGVVFYRVTKKGEYGDLLMGEYIPMGFPTTGGRATMPMAIGILYRLGFRKVYLLGCDFRMSEHGPYCVPKDRTREQAAGSNRLFDAMNRWFDDLAPIFRDAGLTVLNATPGSRLTAFPRRDLADCVARAVVDMPAPETEFPA